MKEIVLALGEGGSKGHAHAGVLRALDRHDFKIRAIAGTSAGGLWGALYAYGYTPAEIERRFLQLSSDSIYSRLPEDAPSWMGLKGIREMLEDALGDCHFENLRIPFAVTAVDLNTAENLTLQTGRVVDAVLATIAFPGVFPAVKLNGRVLVDGGVLDPVPVEPARNLSPGLPVVAVVLSPALDGWSRPEKPQMLGSLPFVSNYLAGFRIAQALGVFSRAMDISGAMLTELLLAVQQPEVILRPAVPHISLISIDFDVEEVVRLGDQAVEYALPKLNQAVSWQGRLMHMLRPHKGRRVRVPYSSDFPKSSPGSLAS
jgi:NTE family protein